MNCRKLLQQMIGVGLVLLPLIGCGAPATSMPAPATPTPDMGEGFVTKAGALCQNSYTLPAAGSSDTIPGQIVILSFLDYELDYPAAQDYKGWHITWGIMPPAEAHKASAVTTIVCYMVQKVRVGVYYEVRGTPAMVNPPGLVPGLPPAGSTQTGVGYKYIWDVRALAWPSGDLIAGTTLSGGDPPQLSQGTGDRYGNDPFKEFDAWLRTLLPAALVPVTPTPSDRRVLASDGPATSVAFSPDGKMLASGSDVVTVWDVGTGKVLYTLRTHTDVVSGLAFSPDGKALASGSWDKTVILWDIASREARQTLSGHAEAVSSVAFSPNGKLVASGSWDQVVILWDVTTGQARQTLRGHTGRVTGVGFSPDGKVIASVGDITVRLWDVATGQSLRVFKGKLGTVDFSSAEMTSVAFSPDGKKLAAGADTNIMDEACLAIWDLQTGESQVLPTTGSSVSSVAFSPDGKILASGSDWTVVLWDVATDQAQRLIRGSYAQVNCVAFSPDGRTLAAGYWDNAVVLWPVGP